MAKTSRATLRSSTAANDWEPQFKLNLDIAKPAAFRQLVDDFEEWRKTQPRPSFKLPDGWHTITPQIAEQILLLNKKGANREASLGTVLYYFRQMDRGDWQPTGQPVIFNAAGELVEGQHREWACYLGGVPFTTYVVNQTEDIVNGFAYIDNVKARSNKDAIYTSTSGTNGQSGVLSQVAKLANAHEAGCFTTSGKKSVERLSPNQVIGFIKDRPFLQRGLSLVSSGEYRAAVKAINHPDVAGYTAALIAKNFNEDLLDDFFQALSEEREDDGDPIAAFLWAMQQDRAKLKSDQLARHLVLGMLIKTFNYWNTDTPIKKKKIGLRVTDNYPEFVQSGERVDDEEDSNDETFADAAE